MGQTTAWLTNHLTPMHGVRCSQDNTVHQLLDRDGMLTVGTEEKDIDWEAMWREQLASDDKDSVRNSAPPHPSVAIISLSSISDASAAAPTSQHVQACKAPKRGTFCLPVE